jgi:truncated hemoglobin YjbI
MTAMTIFRSAYDTLACRDFVMSKTAHALDMALVSGQLGFAPNTQIRELTGGSAISDSAPAFAHPYLLQGKEQDAATVVVDVRSFGKYDPHKAAFVVRSRAEYDSLVLRGQLNHCWVKEAPSVLLNVSPLGMRLFAAWISENITKKFMLDPRESIMLQIYAAFYYYSLFLDQHHLSESDKHRAVAAITKSTGINATDVVKVVEHFETPVQDAEEFCKLAQEVVQSIRLTQLNIGVLYAILGGTWYTNAKEIIAVATEHPPTWLALIAMAVQDRTYHNTAINRLLERLDRKDKGVGFLRALKVTLEAAQA